MLEDGIRIQSDTSRGDDNPKKRMQFRKDKFKVLCLSKNIQPSKKKIGKHLLSSRFCKSID